MRGTRKFAALFDLHFGYERKNGHKVPMHDMKAFGAVFPFLEDFKPDVLIAGGDFLDCGAISHHNKSKPGKTEGLRLAADAEECQKKILMPLEGLSSVKQRTFHIGNHEGWCGELEEEIPGIEGLLDVKKLMKLDKWQVVPEGGYTNVGKLTFIHGNQLSGGEHVAKAAVTSWERNIRFGHFHTHQVYTKVSPIHDKLGRTGIAVPCLCTKDPKYGEGRANRWVQGFNWGYIFPDGSFHDYVSIIINGRMMANGKLYRG